MSIDKIYGRAIKALQEDRDRLKFLEATLTEIANRAANMDDPDAADWLPSIYKLACEALNRDPWQVLKAAGYDEKTLTVTLNSHRTDSK
jgi:hypothetical protein